MKIKVSEATPIQVNWLVAKCESLCLGTDPFGLAPIIAAPIFVQNYKPSTDWSVGGPIIEREGIDIQQVFCYMEGSFSEPCWWQAIRHTKGGPINPPKQIADTPLIAAMRCYCCAKLGEFVEIPEGLCQQENS